MDEHARQAVETTDHVLAHLFTKASLEPEILTESEALDAYRQANRLVSTAANDRDLQRSAELFGMTLPTAIALRNPDQVAGAYAGLTMCFRSYSSTHPDSMLGSAGRILQALAADLSAIGAERLAGVCENNRVTLLMARYISTTEDDSDLLVQAEDLLTRRHDATDRLYTLHSIAILRMRVRPKGDPLQWLISAKKLLRKCTQRLRGEILSDQVVLGYAELGRAEIKIRKLLHSQVLTTSVLANVEQLPRHLRKPASEDPGRIAGLLASNPGILGLTEAPTWLGNAVGAENTLKSRADELRKCLEELRHALSRSGVSQHSRSFGERILGELEWENNASPGVFEKIMRLARSEWMRGNPTELVSEICPVIFAARSTFGIYPPVVVLEACADAYVQVLSQTEQAVASQFVQDNQYAARFIAVLLGELGQWRAAFSLLDAVRGREFLEGWAPPTPRFDAPIADVVTVHVTHNPECTLIVGMRSDGKFFGFVDPVLTGKRLATIWASLQEFNKELGLPSSAAKYRDAVSSAWEIACSLGKETSSRLSETNEYNVLLCPGGLLAAFPLWSALAPQCSKNNQVLFVNVSSASISHFSQANSSPLDRTVTTVDASYAIDSQPLIAGKAELTYIELLAQVPSSRRLRATPASAIGALRSPGIVHFCCHATANAADGLESALVLNDDKLSCREVLSSAPLAADLAVLNACESGLATTNRWADELMCVQTAMMHAGCGRTIGCLWRVRDLASALLMAFFYERLLDDKCLSDGTTAVFSSLMDAQQWLRQASLWEIRDSASRWSIDVTSLSNHGSSSSDKPFEHPIYWAAYYLGSRVLAAPRNDGLQPATV